jgi:CHASE3 domain sensor protein
MRPTAETMNFHRDVRDGGPPSQVRMQRQVSSIRSVLAGFAGLLLLMGCLAVDSARQTRDVSTTSAALRKESRERDTLLDQLLADIYRSATLARDYMLEHDDALAASQKAELQQLRRQVEEALSRYGAHAPAKEQEAVRSLQQHAESY